MNTLEAVRSAWDEGPGAEECASHDWKGGLQIRFSSGGGSRVIGDYLRIETILECLEEAVRRGEIPADGLEEITFF